MSQPSPARSSCARGASVAKSFPDTARMPNASPFGGQALRPLAHPPIPPFPILLAFTLLLTGCNTTRKSDPSPVRPAKGISEIHLFAVPLAINTDATPGADGFAVKVYAVDRFKPKPTAIAEGTLDILMFDGLLPGRAIGTNTPLQVWSYAADQLPLYLHRGTIGDAYEFTPLWTTNRPHADQITVAARYRPPSGDPLFSATSTITVVSQ